MALTVKQQAKRDAIIADYRPSVANIVRTFRAANERQLAEGAAWYAEAHSAARALSPNDITIGAGVIAALSPRMDWTRNLTLAIKAFADGVATGAMPANTAKADRIMNGESALDVLGGDKVRSFFGVIVDPTDAHAVVVDRHAFDVAVGKTHDDETRAPLLAKSWVYDMFADAYREAARILGYSPSQVQAVTWTVWRETHAAYAAANVRAIESAA